MDSARTRLLGRSDMTKKFEKNKYKINFPIKEVKYRFDILPLCSRRSQSRTRGSRRRTGRRRRQRPTPPPPRGRTGTLATPPRYEQYVVLVLFAPLSPISLAMFLHTREIRTRAMGAAVGKRTTQPVRISKSRMPPLQFFSKQYPLMYIA